MEDNELRKEAKLVVKGLLQAWEEIKEQVPGYEVENTGGGIFTVTKNFITKDGRTVGVWMATDVILLKKQVQKVEENGEFRYEPLEGEFIRVEEFDDEHWELHGDIETILGWYGETAVEPNDLMKTLFSQSDIDEMLRVTRILGED